MLAYIIPIIQRIVNDNPIVGEAQFGIVAVNSHIISGLPGSIHHNVGQLQLQLQWQLVNKNQVERSFIKRATSLELLERSTVTSHTRSVLPLLMEFNDFVEIASFSRRSVESSITNQMLQFLLSDNSYLSRYF